MILQVDIREPESVRQTMPVEFKTAKAVLKRDDELAQEIQCQVKKTLALKFYARPHNSNQAFYGTAGSDELSWDDAGNLNMAFEWSGAVDNKYFNLQPQKFVLRVSLPEGI